MDFKHIHSKDLADRGSVLKAADKANKHWKRSYLNLGKALKARTLEWPWERLHPSVCFCLLALAINFYSTQAIHPYGDCQDLTDAIIEALVSFLHPSLPPSFFPFLFLLSLSVFVSPLSSYLFSLFHWLFKDLLFLKSQYWKTICHLHKQFQWCEFSPVRGWLNCWHGSKGNKV